MVERRYKELIDKYLSGTISASETDKLLYWLENDTQLNQWWAEELSKVNNKMDTDLQDNLLEKIKRAAAQNQQNAVASIHAQKSPSKHYLNVLKWVAVICFPILLFITAYMYVSQTEQYNTPLIVKAERGDQASLVLPDGTKVSLNSASQLSYFGNYGKKERCVELAGEAYFNVTHDINHPFIVQTGVLEVKVMGTSFNVSSYEDQENVTIVLLEGKVRVFADDKSYSMAPNDKIVYNKSTHKISASKVYSKDYIEWTKGNLYFENEPLNNIIKVLERVYNIDIRIESEELKKECFTGTIGSGGIRNALDKLMMASSFTYEVKNSVIFIRSMK